MKFYSAALVLNLFAQWEIFPARRNGPRMDLNVFDASNW